MGAPSTRQSKPLMWFFFFFFGLAHMFICSIFDLVISILKPGHFPNHPNFSLLLKSLELGLYWACIPLGRLIGEQHGGQGRGRLVSRRLSGQQGWGAGLNALGTWEGLVGKGILRDQIPFWGTLRVQGLLDLWQLSQWK